MKRVYTETILNWNIATKTKSIKAKPLISLMVDRSVVNKFLIDTLEGREPLGDGAIICVGEAGDTWQQSQKKLLQKYDVTEIDNDGWMICVPYPDNSVNAIEVTKEMCDKNGIFYVIGQWGETIDKILKNKKGIKK